jgi:signal transduction histidine kinase
VISTEACLLKKLNRDENCKGGRLPRYGKVQGDGKSEEDRIAEVSHELRLPLANLKLLVETLLDGAYQDHEVCLHMLNRCNDEVERLVTLVNNLLSAESLLSTRRESGMTWLDLKDSASYAFDLNRAKADGKSVELKLAIPDEWLIYANPEQFDQVLINLVENAVKFSHTGSEVVIGSGSEKGSFFVQDSGIGMDASQIPKIFRRFYRVDRSGNDGSTGLGLSIVKHIVDLHGAKITVNSEPGIGSSFHLNFPAPQGAEVRE